MLTALFEWLGFATCVYAHPTIACQTLASTLASLASAGCGWRSWHRPTRRPRLLLTGQAPASGAHSSGSQKHGSRSLSSSFVTSDASGS